MLWALEDALQAFENDRMSGGDLCARFRACAQHWPGLPNRFTAVLETLLQALESSALFSEESCAFSRHDLAASLRQWLQAAHLTAPQSGIAQAWAPPPSPAEHPG